MVKPLIDTVLSQLTVSIEDAAASGFQTSIYDSVFFVAEGTGLEPATGFPAPHFQCGR